MLGGFSAQKLKPQLKMAGSRIQIASNKKAALLKQNMREIALMLSDDPPKEEKAKIRAEALIRDDNLIEAYEILQLECELLHERIKLIEYSKDCPTDLVPVVATLMWASHRVDIPELLLIRKQFRAKYGKQFEDDALCNKNAILNERVVTKLSVEPPAAYLVQTYLERICEQFEVDWTPQVKLSTNQMIEPMAAPVGYSVQVAQGTGLGAVAYALPPGVNPNGMSYNNHYDDTFKGGGGGGSVPPIVTAQPYIPPTPSSQQQQQQQQQRQQQQQTPTSPNNNNNDFAEVDIFVPGVIPGAPTAPPGSVASGLTQSITGQTTKTAKQQPPPASEEDKKEDDDDQGNDNGNTNGGGNHTASNGGVGDNNGGSSKTTTASTPSKANSTTTSYADLAARFQQLKK